MGRYKNTFVEEFSNDTTKGPDIDCVCVVGSVVQLHLRSSIVASGDILSQIVVFVDVSNLDIGLSKVTYFYFPVFINQYIQCLQITVYHPSRMNVDKSLDDAVGEVMNMV